MSTPTARFRGYFFSKKIKLNNNKSHVYKVDEIYKRYEFSFKRLKLCIGDLIEAYKCIWVPDAFICFNKVSQYQILKPRRKNKS